MLRIDALFKALDEATIAEKATKKHDITRDGYTVSCEIHSYEDFLNVIGDYYNYHISTCVAVGGSLSDEDAKGEAEDIIRQKMKKHPMHIYKDVTLGVNGGIYHVLDQIRDYLKDKSMMNYSRIVFSRHVDKGNRKDCIYIAKQLIDKYGPILGIDINQDAPEMYADHIEEMIFNITRAVAQVGKGYRSIAQF